MKETRVLVPVTNLATVDKGVAFAYGEYIHKMYTETNLIHLIHMEKEIMEKIEPFPFLIESN